MKTKKIEGKLKIFFLKYFFFCLLKIILGNILFFFNMPSYYSCDVNVKYRLFVCNIFLCFIPYGKFTLAAVVQGEGTLLATGSYDGQARIWTSNGRAFFFVLRFCNNLYRILCGGMKRSKKMPCS